MVLEGSLWCLISFFHLSARPQRIIFCACRGLETRFGRRHQWKTTRFPYALPRWLPQMWSNGRYRSAEHRVVYGGSKKSRLSVVFLLDFMDKFEIRCPDELIDEKHPQIYRPVIFEDLKAYYKQAGPSLGGPPPYFLLETESHKGNSVDQSL